MTYLLNISIHGQYYLEKHFLWKISQATSFKLNHNRMLEIKKKSEQYTTECLRIMKFCARSIFIEFRLDLDDTIIPWIQFTIKKITKN